MLNKPIEEIIIENGKVVGVKSEGEVSYLSKVHLECNLYLIQTEQVVSVVLLALLQSSPSNSQVMLSTACCVGWEILISLVLNIVICLAINKCIQ